MSLSMYDASVPVLVHSLKNLSGILKKAAVHAKAKGIDPAVLVNARLFPDMFPLARQVQIATDMAKGCGARLAGVELPSYADTETTFPELQERISRTIAFLRSLKRAQFDGSSTRALQLQMRMGSIGFDGKDYLVGWVLPNFYFHMATAYNILRHNGVEIGKPDFLGQVPGARMNTGKASKPAKAKATAKKK